MDRISSLPDEVLSHILSFFPIKESARTSVLSKRWRILFAFLPNLDLSEDDYSQSFVDRVLAVSGNSPIKKFSLSCTKASSEPTRFNRWIRDVLNRGVLDLDLSTKAEDWYVLPCEVFTCKTIKKLKLSGFLIAALPENAFLPSLESIILKSVRFCSFKGCAFAKLLSACPVLEELVILDLNWEQWLWSRKITSRSLQRLTIRRRQFRGFNLLYSGSITFDTPSVTHLDYYDYASRSFATVNLDSLVEANLDLFVRVDHRRTWNPTNLIKGLRNIELLNLVSLESLEMFYLFREAIPVFENLVHLSITTAFNYCWRGLPIMLNKSPNLETLTIKGTLHCDPIDCECLSGYSFVLSCPVKVLKIAEYMGTIGEVEKLKHFLGKLSCLELLEVEIQGTDIEDKFEITKGLLMLPRASSKCKIKVK